MKTTEKNKITQVLDVLIQNYQVFAPVATDEFTINFQEITDSGQAKLDFYNSKEPPKKLLFPQYDALFSYGKDGSVRQPPLERVKSTVIFGLRPCDARSLTLLDYVFDAQDYKDPYFLARRKQTTIFTLACNRPQTSCFCTSMGLGPFSKDGSDVFVVDLGDRYIFEHLTDAGRDILAIVPDLGDASDADIARCRELQAQAEKTISRHIEIGNLVENLDKPRDDSFWQEMSENCLGCSLCTYLCPTCHCFDIIDEPGRDGGERSRIWDSCMRETFTQEASGHNPRPMLKDRMRQRLMHKFNYFAKNYGQLACVGCGRCLRNCPAGWDITGAIAKINL